MKNRRSLTAVLFIILLFFVVLGISFFAHWSYPVKAISGESSAGTWMSCALLIISATITLSIGLQRGWYPWLLISAFFFVLAIDERFMLHEQLKERLIFSLQKENLRAWIFEMPVIAGAIFGMALSLVIWRQLNHSLRGWLAAAIALGVVSVIFDIFRMGVVPEDLFKLFAELIITCTLLAELSYGNDT
jgi:hypothetical protein